MKRYLNKLKFKKILVITLFTGLFLPLSSSIAEGKQDYYRKLFGKEFGFTMYESDKEKSKDEDYLSSNLKKGYAVVLSSSISDENTVEEDEEEVKSDEFINYFEPYKKVILICDNDFSADYPFEFSCDDREVFSEEALNLGKFLRSTGERDIDLYVIPESILLSPDERSDLSKFFSAIKRSDEAPEVSEDAKLEEEERSILSDLKDFKDTMVFEFFSIAFYMFILASLSWGLLRFLTKEDKRFDIEVFKSLSESFKNLHLYQKILIPILVSMVLIYIPLVFLISLKDGQGVNIGYLVSYTLETFSISKLNEFSQTGSFFRIGLFAYGIVFIGLFFLFILPLFLKVLTRAVQNISEAKIKPDVLKYIFPSLVILSLIGVSFFEISEAVKFLVFIFVILVFLFVKNAIDRNFEYSYAPKEKTLLLITFFIIATVGFMLRIRDKGVEIDYRTEDLIGVPDEVVLLPYSKQLGKNTLIKEYNFSGSEPVFVDYYLVYSPIHSRVENKNALDFRNEGSFYIQNGDVSDIVYAAHSNRELFNVLVSQAPSNFFRIRNLNSDMTELEKTEIEITFSCLRENFDSDGIKADFYHVGEDGEVQKEDEKLMYFPGCSEIEKPEVVRVEFDLPYTESEYIYVRLQSVLSTDIEDIKIIISDMLIEPVYLSKDKGYTVIDSGGFTTSARVPITNYIFSDSYDLSFDINLNETDEFDMSGPINELIMEGVLKDRFLIWSTQKYLPVRLPD